MKNQKIRRFILLLSFILLPATLNYFSPYLIIEGLFEKVIGGAFVIWLLFLLSSLVFGRAACSYVCPYGGLQMLIDKFHGKSLKQIAWLRWFKYGLGVIWISAIIVPLVLVGGQKQFNMLYMTENFVSVDHWGKLIFYYMLITILAIMPFILGKRAVCHYLCPMSILTITGSKLSNCLNTPSLHLTVRKDKCIKCGKCNKACPMSLDVMGMVQKGNMRNTECILCGECCSACGCGVLRREFGSRTTVKIGENEKLGAEV
ncbi:MAG TPA: 4Fe-4S binding protein [Clostridia bacterium]|nr:4Fe-4S binding protein [Clostridia bacterium]